MTEIVSYEQMLTRVNNEGEEERGALNRFFTLQCPTGL